MRAHGVFTLVSVCENTTHFPFRFTQRLLAQSGGRACPAQVPSVTPLYVSRAASASTIDSFQSDKVNDFTSHGIDGNSLMSSAFVPRPCSLIETPSAASHI